MTTAQRRGYRGRRVASKSRPAPKSRPAAKGQVTKIQRRRTIQLAVAGIIFVLLAMGKLLLPEAVGGIAGTLRSLLSQDADFKAAFSAVGEAIAGEKEVGESLEEAYTAVFAPAAYRAQRASAMLETVETVTAPADRLREELEDLVEPEAGTETEEEPERQAAESQTLVSFSAAAPANVSFQQAVMGFAYTTPAQGTMTDAFGYRIHPIYKDRRFHYGLDIANVQGTAISAFADGTVKAIGESDALGLYVMLDHPNDITTLYAHCSSVSVSTGQQVEMGETIAAMGATGLATGSHLHFEVHRGDTYLNPIYYVEVH